MARLSSQYDKEVGKVFVIRGDEAYARTTDSRVKVMASDRTDFNNYRCGLLCNVYRDRGESKITLYNGDIVVNQFDWSDNTEQMYIGMNNAHTAIDPNTCLELAWGVPHEIYIRYKGNNQCLPSKSKVLQIYEPLPDEFATNITMTTSKSNNNVTVTVTLDINGVATVGTHNTDIEIYVDDELKATINTGDSNTASTTIENIDVGIHTITAIVVGTDRIHSATAYEEIVMGDKVEIIKYPYPFIKLKDNDFAIKVTSYTGEPISGASVLFDDTSYTTDSDGIAEFTLQHLPYGEYTASYNGVESDPILIDVYPLHTTITATNGVVSNDRTDTLNISLVDTVGLPVAYSGVPVTLTKRYRNIPSSQSYISRETLYTDSNGKISKTITGGAYNEYGTGLFTYESEASSSPANVDDVIYYHTGNNRRWGENALIITNGYIDENINGRVVSNNSSQDPVISFNGNKGNSWNMSFRVATYSIDNFVCVEVNEGVYHRIQGTSPVVSPDCSVELRYNDGSLYVYEDGSFVDRVPNCNPTGRLKIINVEGLNTKKALFYNLKFVRTG